MAIMGNKAGCSVRAIRKADENVSPPREVGWIVLGDRVFTIELGPAVSCRSGDKEGYLFEIAGQRFVAFEADDRVRAPAPGTNDDVASRLSGRELEIAVLVAQGHKTKSIAFRLQISEWTVTTYLRRVFAKLDVDNRAAMVYRCAPLINMTRGAASSLRPKAHL